MSLVLHLCNNGILDLTVDSSKLLSEQLLGLVDQPVKAVLNVVTAGLVATLGDDLGVVAGTTTVPGEKLEYNS